MQFLTDLENLTLVLAEERWNRYTQNNTNNKNTLNNKYPEIELRATSNTLCTKWDFLPIIVAKNLCSYLILDWLCEIIRIKMGKKIEITSYELFVGWGQSFVNSTNSNVEGVPRMGHGRRHLRSLTMCHWWMNMHACTRTSRQRIKRRVYSTMRITMQYSPAAFTFSGSTSGNRGLIVQIVLCALTDGNRESRNGHFAEEFFLDCSSTAWQKAGNPRCLDWGHSREDMNCVSGLIFRGANSLPKLRIL